MINTIIYIVFDTDCEDDPEVFTSAEDAIDYFLVDTTYRKLKKVDLAKTTFKGTNK